MPEYRIYEFRTQNNNGGSNWKDKITSILPILGLVLIMWIGFIGLSGVIGRLYVMLPIIPIFIMSLVLHELSHACIANFLGDPTPRLTGRLTLNPIKHLDLWGTLVFFFCCFGCAKTVQVDA